MNYIYNDELYHHGVKGMKWGVRHDYIPKGRTRRSPMTRTKRRNVARGITIGSSARLAGHLAGAAAGAAALGLGAHYIKKKTGLSAGDAISAAKSLKDLTKPMTADKKQAKAMIDMAKKSMTKDQIKKWMNVMDESSKKGKLSAETKEVRKAYGKEYNKRVGKEIVQNLFRNKSSEILDAANKELGKSAAEDAFRGIKKGIVTGIGTSAGVGVVGGITYGANAAISGTFDRKKMAEYVAPNPTKAKFDRQENERKKLLQR